MKMVFVNITGGLGNQMFQYAAALSLATKHNTAVSICFDKMEELMSDPSITERALLIDKLFELPFTSVANSKDFKYLTSKNVWSKLKRKLLKTELFYENSFEFIEDFNGLGQNVYMEGYFQSEKYFDNYKKLVQSAFQFKLPRSSQTEGILNLIKGKESIAIHIRRGDYISNVKNSQTHGFCGLEYYQRAISHFLNLENTHFIIVSDDISWCKDNIKFKSEYSYVDWNTADDSWQDMYIISQCNHAIIANSSFSWWGAYLISNVNKIVISPKIWFADIAKQKQTKDLIPSSWIKI